MLNHALHYARIGYPVFPLQNPVLRDLELGCTCREWEVCDKQGKHPRTQRGYKDATTDENKIIDWWHKYTGANIGLLTGIESGILVLDVDIKGGGEYSLEYLQDDYRILLGKNFEPLPSTLTTNTGSGGRHLYFKYPLEFKNLKGSASKIAEGLDIRANGNYIIAPPSQHISGNYYSWSGRNTSIEDAPDWLIYQIIKADKEDSVPSISPASRSPKLRNGEKIKEGGRNNYLFRQVSGLVNSYSKEEVLKRVLLKNSEDLEEPLKDKEVIRIVEWAWKQYVEKKGKGLPLKE